MATFTNTPQNVSPYATMPLHTPDFGFLAKVYGTKQAQYDRGFDAVQSFYSSILSGDLTNPENKKFREDAFKKIQSTIKSFSHVDLSKSQNISLAYQAIDPIAKNKDFAYDLWFTPEQNKTKQKLEAIRNSSDADIRNTYNEDSAMMLQFADEDMQNAKRNTGEIQNVQPVKFVPKQDIIKYLNDMAKDQGGLKFEQVQVGNDGYIYTITNGPAAGQTFGQWATTMMGDRFNEQLSLSGHVQAESTIRSYMKDNDVSREEAQDAIAKKLGTEMFKSVQGKVDVLENRYKTTKNELDLLEKSYMNYDGTMNFGKKQYLEGKHEALKVAVKQYENDMKNGMQSLADISKDNYGYIKNNLSGLLTNTNKEQIALAWGDSYANSHIEQKIVPDSEFAAKRRLAFDQHKENIDNQFRQAELILKQQELELKKEGNATEIAKLKAEGKLPATTYLGATSSQAKYPSVELLANAVEENIQQLKNVGFGTDGIISIAFEKEIEKTNNYSNVAQKLVDYSLGQGSPLNANELLVLQAFSKDVGEKYIAPTNEQQASLMVESLGLGVYNKAFTNARILNDIGKQSVVTKQLENEIAFVGAMDNLNISRKKLAKISNDIAEQIQAHPEIYENAKPSGFVNGVQTYDLSGLTEAQKERLNDILPADIRKLETSPAVSFSQNMISPAELNFIKNIPEVAQITLDGIKMDKDFLRKVNEKELKEVLGNNLAATYDASAQMMTIRVSPDLSKSKSLGIKKGELLEITIPYSSIQSEKALIEWNEKINKYSTKYTPLTITEKLYNDNKANYSITQSIGGQSGLQMRIGGGTNSQGQYGANLIIKMKDPNTGEERTENKFYPIRDKDNMADYLEIEQLVFALLQQYKYHIYAED